MKGHGPFTTLTSVSPWWLRDYPLVMEPEIQVGLGKKGPSLSRPLTMADVWLGPTPLILGPSSWGFGIGPSPGTAVAPPPEWPAVAHPYMPPGPYGL